MNVDTAVTVIERFFLDLIGTIIPGSAFIVGSQELLVGPLSLGVPLDPLDPQFNWIVFIGTAYVLGHALASLSHRLDRVVGKTLGLGTAKKKRAIKKGGEYKLFVNTIRSLDVGGNLPEELDRSFHTYRNLAMSAAPEEDAKVYRFRFLSLLNGGVAMVLLLLLGIWIGCLLIPQSVLGPVYNFRLELAILGLGAIFIFRERELYFWRITMKLPFAVAAAKLTELGTLREPASTARRSIDEKSTTAG